jgi:hypothetical protein
MPPGRPEQALAHFPSKTTDTAFHQVGSISGLNGTGWVSDGAVVNGTRLVARAVLGLAVANVLDNHPLPVALAAWVSAFSHIAVTSGNVHPTGISLSE